MKQSELFEKIKEILSRPGAWIQDDMARDIYGYRCRPQDVMACEFSLLGATKSVEYQFNTIIVWHESPLELCRWNDAPGRTLQQVLDKVELEIKIARIREEFACAA
jgi:hypothetical protein